MDTESVRMHKACSLICARLIQWINRKDADATPLNLNALKAEVSASLKLANMPKLIDIIGAVPEKYRSQLLPLLKAKPVRTASGVAVVAVMCKPHRCPHIATTGNVCVYV